MPNRRMLFNVRLLGLYCGHIWAIVGPCFGNFYNIFTYRCLKWLAFSTESCMPIRKYSSMLMYWDHIEAIFGPCIGYFYHIIAFRCINPISYRLKHQVLKMFSFLATHWNVQTDWKLVQGSYVYTDWIATKKNCKNSVDWW